MKIPGNIVCDNKPCTFSKDVEDLAPHMNDNCPQCGKPLMDDTDRMALGVVVSMVNAGVIVPCTRDEGDFTLNSAEMKV